MKFRKISFLVIFVLTVFLFSGCKKGMILGFIDASYDKAIECYPVVDFHGLYEGRVSISRPGPYYWGDQLALEFDKIDSDVNKCAVGWSLSDQINGKLKIKDKNTDGTYLIVQDYIFKGYDFKSFSGNSGKLNDVQIPARTYFKFDIYDQYGSQKQLHGNGNLTRSSKWPYQIDLKITDMYTHGGNKKPYLIEIQVIKKD